MPTVSEMFRWGSADPQGVALTRVAAENGAMAANQGFIVGSVCQAGLPCCWVRGSKHDYVRRLHRHRRYLCPMTVTRALNKAFRQRCVDCTVGWPLTVCRDKAQFHPARWHDLS
jgi:hypothetical protein